MPYSRLRARSTANLLGDCVMEVWFTPYIMSANKYLICHGLSGETEEVNVTYSIYTSGSTLEAQWERGTGTNESASSGYDLSIGARYHIVAERDATAKTVKFTVNDAVVATVGYANNPTGGGSGLLRIGSFDTSGYSAGIIDEVAVYDHLLGPARVSVHYNAGLGL